MGESDPCEGEILGDRYRIGERIAAGGMGSVHRGVQIALDREIAIKLLHGWMALDVRARRRFEVEAQAMAKLRHPHCAQVLDFGLHGETPYLVMEFVEGETLGEMLDRGRLPPERAALIARQTLSALAHAHHHGITHRDIKPDNLIVGETAGVGVHVRVLDFGIARLREDGGVLTGGMAIGTPKYMAPEQARGEGADGRADLYATAVVLYHALAGAPPFSSEENVEILRMHREAPPPRVADKAAEVAISAALEDVIARGLAKDPADRFQDAESFAEALSHCPEASGLAPGRSSHPEIARAPFPEPPPSGAHPIPAASPEPPPSGGHPIPAASPEPPPSESHPMVAAFGSAPVAGHSAPVAGHSAPVAGHSAPLATAHGPANRPAGAAERAWAWARRRPAAAAAGGFAGAVAVAALLAALASGEGDDGDASAAPAESGEEEATATSGEEPPPPLERAREIFERDPEAAVGGLERMATEHEDAAEIHYLLGRAYFSRMWWTDGMRSFRRAFSLDDSYRQDEALIETVTRGFISPRAHDRIGHFLAEEIGPAAEPYVREVAENADSQGKRNRASQALERFE